ncbi:hypothetical protein SFUMM280S_00125 [Streptomyces fumanus]
MRGGIGSGAGAGCRGRGVRGYASDRDGHGAGRIPAARGATVLYSPYLLHHQATSFPDPERFRPERWAPGRTAGRAAGGDALLPFAAGSRKCVADTFAMAEATVAVAVVARHWRLRSPSRPIGRPRPAVTLGTPVTGAGPGATDPGPRRGAALPAL